jgi:hypothetical protein
MPVEARSGDGVEIAGAFIFHSSSSNSENIARVMRQPRGVARFGAWLRGRLTVFGAA